MSAYTKLASNIIHSTIWQAPDHVFRVWITMLALKDRDHVVEASIPGLARAAGRSIPETEQALAMFLAPDPYSRTKTDDGRRIREVDGGWFVINGDLYNDRGSVDDYREKAAARQARFKARKKAREAKDGNAESNAGNVSGNAESRSVTPSTLLCSAATEPTRAPSAPVVDESLRFPEQPDASNFNRRDLERAVSAERGNEWRCPSARWDVKQADDTAALIMAAAAKSNCDPHELARRAFRGWLESQKSIDPIVWCKNWNAALPPPPKPQRERAIL